MQKNGLTKDNIFEKGKDLSYPESAVEYFKGMVGRPDGGFPDDISKIVLKDQKPIEGRAGELLEPADFDKMGQELMEKFNFDHVNIRIYSAMLFTLRYMMTTAHISSIITMFHALTATYISTDLKRARKQFLE